MVTRHRTATPHAPSAGTLVPFRAHRRLVLDDDAAEAGGEATHAARGRARDVAQRAASGAARLDDDAPSAIGGESRNPLLPEGELRAIEETYAEGITAVQIVEVFTSRGIKFSEASFRKYVQQGLLPRSRRVGRKGKHRGSLGVYPAKTIRRINAVKQLMSDGYTIEEIQGQFLLYTDLVEGVAEGLGELWTRLGRDLERRPEAERAALAHELSLVRKDGDRLVDRLGDLTRRVAAPRTDRLRLAGAAGGAEDLL